MTHDAFHLPGLRPEDVRSWDVRPVGGHAIRFPRLHAGAMRRLVTGLIETRARVLALRETAAVARAIDRAAARLADPSDPLRQLADAALPVMTGYSGAMVRHGLDHITRDWRLPALDALISSELPDAAALDRFVARPGGGMTRAFGPELALHVFAGNVPGVAVTSLVRSLLVKAATLGKTASGEPLLPVLFVRALAETDPQLAGCVAVTYWPGGDPVEEEVFPLADVVVVYGGHDAVENARRRAPPRTRVLAHGPKLSFGMVGVHTLASDPDADAAAEEAAMAVATFDQQGCVSPHLFYVESGGSITPQRFAALLASHLGRLEGTLPRGTVTAAEAAAIQTARAAAEFRAIAGEDVSTEVGTGTSWTVIYETDPTFSASCLNRLVRVKPVTRLEDVPAHVTPFRDVLQTVSIAGAGSRLEALAAALGAVGATRITTLAAMPWPATGSHHDGRGPLRELLHWVDIEPGFASRGPA